MATSAERKALIFLAAVVCLGAGARIARSRGDAALAAAGGAGRGNGRDALAAQISAVDAARAGIAGPAGARPTRRSKKATRRPAPDSATADTLADSVPRARAHRSRARSAASAPPANPVDGWALRPVQTHLSPGGFGVVRGGAAVPTPDTSAPRTRRRRRPD